MFVCFSFMFVCFNVFFYLPNYPNPEKLLFDFVFEFVLKQQIILSYK